MRLNCSELGREILKWQIVETNERWIFRMYLEFYRGKILKSDNTYHDFSHLNISSFIFAVSTISLLIIGS